MDENDLAAFAERTLDKEAIERIEAHLVVCPACRDLLRSLSAAYGDKMFASGSDGAQGVSAQPDDEAGFKSGDRFGRYLLLGRIGKGAMGVVYKAADTALDRIVALKLLHKPARDGSEMHLRFRREARVLAQIKHPNVCAVYDFGAVQDVAFISMEWIDGMTLRRWLYQARPGWKQVREVLRQAARGLEAAHRVGVVHRDFKPENVIIRSDGTAVVTDFGLARFDDTAQASDDSTLTAPGTKIGTPLYMAPEVHLGCAAGPSSDLFSFTVVLFEGLFGFVPFPGDSPMQKTDAIRTGARLDIPNTPRLPKALKAALLMGLKQEPHERQPNIEHWTRVLESSRPFSLYAVKAAAVAAGLLAVCGLGFWAGARRTPDRELAPQDRAASPSAMSLPGPSGHPAATWLEPARTLLKEVPETQRVPTTSRESASAPDRILSSPKPLAKGKKGFPKEPSAFDKTNPYLLGAKEAPERKGRSVSAHDPGRLTVQTKPWSKVYVDGEFIKSTPLLDYELAPGFHSVSVELPASSGVKPLLRSYRIKVEAGRLTWLVKDLK